MNKLVKLAISLVVLAATFAFAQEDGGIRFGARVGWNLSVYGDSDGKQVGNPEEAVSFGFLGLGAGLTVIIPITEIIDINPELFFSYNKYPLMKGELFGEEYGLTEMAINVPVLVQIHPIGEKHYFGIGAQLGIPLSSEFYSKSGGYEETEKAEGRSSIDFSIAFGYSFMITSDIRFDVRAVRSLTQMHEDESDGHLEQLGIGFSYLF